MLRKMVMMRMLIGNMRRPLSIPTMISRQVISSEPGKESSVSDKKHPKTRPSHDHRVAENSAHWCYGSPQLVKTLIKGLYAICSMLHNILWSI